MNGKKKKDTIVHEWATCIMYSVSGLFHSWFCETKTNVNIQFFIICVKSLYHVKIL